MNSENLRSLAASVAAVITLSAGANLLPHPPEAASKTLPALAPEPATAEPAQDLPRVEDPVRDTAPISAELGATDTLPWVEAADPLPLGTLTKGAPVAVMATDPSEMLSWLGAQAEEFPLGTPEVGSAPEAPVVVAEPAPTENLPWLEVTAEYQLGTLEAVMSAPVPEAPVGTAGPSPTEDLPQLEVTAEFQLGPLGTLETASVPPAPAPEAQRSSDPPRGPVDIPVALTQKELSPEARQELFVGTLLPLVHQENQSLIHLRQRLVPLLRQVREGNDLSPDDTDWLQKLASDYRVTGDVLTDPKAQTELTARIDVIPPALVLAQAALESGWGSSLAAKQDRDLFGMLSVVSEESKKRRKSKTAKAREPRFVHLRDSVQNYMLNLNSHAAYRGLRDMRANARKRGKLPESQQLAEGLTRYSILGKQYVKMVKTMIREHGLASYDRSILAYGPNTGDS